jgi:hypothetical protein
MHSKTTRARDLEGVIINPELRDVVLTIRSAVQTYTQEDELRNALENLIEIPRARFLFFGHITARDYSLRRMGKLFASRYITKDVTTEYEVIGKCHSCNTKREAKGDVGEKIRQIISVDALPAIPNSIEDTYVFEVAFRTGVISSAFEEKGFNPHCPECDDVLAFTSSRHIIRPITKQPIHALALRVKSGGRLADKLLDWVLYDRNAEQRTEKRSLKDVFAFSFILESPALSYGNIFDVQQPSQVWNEKKRLKFLEDVYRKQFFRTYGTELPADKKYEDAACYELLQMLTRDYNQNDLRLQDNISSPLMRKHPRHGRVEPFKMLQLNFVMGKERFEGQIKTRETYEREQDRRSAISHLNRVEVSDQLMKARLDNDPRAKVVYSILRELFSEDKGGACWY